MIDGMPVEEFWPAVALVAFCGYRAYGIARFGAGIDPLDPTPRSRSAFSRTWVPRARYMSRAS